MKGDHGFSVSHKAHSCLHIRPIRPPSIGGSHCTRSRCLSIPDVRGSAVHDQRFTPTSPLSLHLRPGAYFRGRESLDESQDLKPVATVTPAPWKTGQRGCFTLHAAYQRTGGEDDQRTEGQEDRSSFSLIVTSFCPISSFLFQKSVQSCRPVVSLQMPSEESKAATGAEERLPDVLVSMAGCRC